MFEIKILNDTCVTVQKTLNQWKHEYQLKVLSAIPCPHIKGNVLCTLRRTRKGA